MEEKSIRVGAMKQRLKERARKEGESQVGNWWRNCWLLVGSYLGSSGLLSGRAGFFLAPQSLSLCLGVDQIWHPYIFLCVFPVPCIFNLSFFSFIFLPSYYYGLIPLDIRPSRESDIMQRAVDWKRATGEGGSEASRGSKVSLQQDRGGWGGKHRLCFFLSPPPQHTSQSNT